MSHTSARYHSHPRGVEGSELSSAKHATVEPAVETKASSLQTPSPELEIPAAKAAGAITRACPACGATRRHALRFRTNGCNILQCGDCGLGRTETSGFDPAAYYTKDYLSGTCDRACGSPLEDRPGLADRFPIAAHAWNALGRARQLPVVSGYLSTCSMPCVSFCGKRPDRRPSCIAAIAL